MAELWDAYDATLTKINNVTLVRGETVPEGMFHLVCDVVVKHTDGTYLLMQRDFRKHMGGTWELTAGGSALQGETPLQCAHRELFEETGIKAEALQEIGRVPHEQHRSYYVEYLCVTDCDKSSIVLQEGETVDFKWVDAKTLLTPGLHVLASARTLEIMLAKSMI